MTSPADLKLLSLHETTTKDLNFYLFVYLLVMGGKNPLQIQEIYFSAVYKTTLIIIHTSLEQQSTIL